jgi:hypothetical protein
LIRNDSIEMDLVKLFSFQSLKFSRQINDFREVVETQIGYLKQLETFIMDI